MKLVPRGQPITGEEPHPLDPRQESLQGRGPISALDVIIQWLNDQPHTLGLTQPISPLPLDWLASPTGGKYRRRYWINRKPLGPGMVRTQEFISSSF